MIVWPQFNQSSNCALQHTCPWGNFFHLPSLVSTQSFSKFLVMNCLLVHFLSLVYNVVYLTHTSNELPQGSLGTEPRLF